MAKKSGQTLGSVTLFWNALSLGVERWMMMVNDRRNRAGDDSTERTDPQEWERWKNLAFAGVLEVKQRLGTLATDLEPFVPDAPRVTTRIGLLADRLWAEWLPMVKPGPWTEAEATTIRELYAEVKACVGIVRNAAEAERALQQDALSRDEWRVLTALHDAPHALHQEDIGQATRAPGLPALGRKTVGICLDRLRGLGLSERCGGEQGRGGETITTKGRAVVRSKMAH